MKISYQEKVAHIEKMEGGFMENAREEFWENQPEEVQKYYRDQEETTIEQ